MVRRLLPTDRWVRLLIVPVLVFIALMSDRGYLADFWHHLARGRAMVSEGRIVDRDLFTFTVADREFQDVNWLTQVVYFRLYKLGGLDLVRCVNALTLAVTLAWLVILCRRLSGSLAVASAVGIATFFGLWQILTIRPQTFSLLLFVVTLDVLERSRRQPRLLVIPPVLVGLWANLHGAFPAGIMLIGCFFLAAAWNGVRGVEDKEGSAEGEGAPLCTLRSPRWLHFGLCVVAALVATLANPYGWKIYQYVGLTSNMAAARRIDEWVPPTLDLWIGKAWLASLVVLAGLLAASWLVKRRPAAWEVLLIVCFLPLACGSVRMVAWWLLVAAPLAARRIVQLWPTTRDQKTPQPTLAAGLVCGVLAVFLVLSLPPLQRFHPLLATRQGPRVEDDLDAVHTHLKTHRPAGRLFSRFEWGEYLSWSYYPSYKVFMDGRIEIYPDPIWQDYAAVTCGQAQWQAILDRHHVDALILDAGYHAKTGLLRQVKESTAWQCVYQSREALLFLRCRKQAQNPKGSKTRPGA